MTDTGRGVTYLRELLRALLAKLRRKMKVRVKQGGFFYDNRAVPSGEELDVPKEIGEDWVASDIAEEVKPERSSAKEKTTRKDSKRSRETAPKERTVAPGPEETRG
jgi:hypothetical protein